VEILLGAVRSLQQMGVLTIESMDSAAVDQYFNRVKIELQGRTVWALSVSAATSDTVDAQVAHVENTIRKNIVRRPYDQNGNEMPLPEAVRQVMERVRGSQDVSFGVDLESIVAGCPIATRKIALLLAACGEKNSVTSSSKNVRPVAPRR